MEAGAEQTLKSRTRTDHKGETHYTILTKHKFIFYVKHILLTDFP